MNIYIFGSVTRGEVDEYSDIDLLVITPEENVKMDATKYSIYSPKRIKEMFNEGNPFAWHLFYESKLVYTTDEDYLQSLGMPSKYKNIKNDLLKFQNLFEQSIQSLIENNLSLVFDLSMVFLSIRNFATCYSLDRNYLKPIFSRNSFEKIEDFPLILDEEVKQLLMMSRVSATRGLNYNINNNSFEMFLKETDKIRLWFNQILKHYEN